jgi:3-hydroxyacyl-CoA dehydrogenase
VAAQSGHDVTMVDMTEDILKKTTTHIEKSLSRVAKKQFKDDAAVRKENGQLCSCTII